MSREFIRRGFYLFERVFKVVRSDKYDNVVCELQDLAFACDMFSAIGGIDVEKQRAEDGALREAFAKNSSSRCFSIYTEFDVSMRGEFVYEPAQFGGQSQFY